MVQRRRERYNQKEHRPENAEQQGGEEEDGSDEEEQQCGEEEQQCGEEGLMKKSSSVVKKSIGLMTKTSSAVKKSIGLMNESSIPQGEPHVVLCACHDLYWTTHPQTAVAPPLLPHLGPPSPLALFLLPDVAQLSGLASQTQRKKSLLHCSEECERKKHYCQDQHLACWSVVAVQAWTGHCRVVAALHPPVMDADLSWKSHQLFVSMCLD